MKSYSGFTLVELLVVITIIAVVAGGSLLVIDPARRIHAAHNSQRSADILTIMASLKRFQADHDGNLPTTGTLIDEEEGTVQLIGGNVGPCAQATCQGYIVASSQCGLESLGTDLRPYIKDLPLDPTLGTTNNTYYFVNKDAYGILTVGACNAEGEGRGGTGLPPVIQITK